MTAPTRDLIELADADLREGAYLLAKAATADWPSERLRRFLTACAAELADERDRRRLLLLELDLPTLHPEADDDA